MYSTYSYSLRVRRMFYSILFNDHKKSNGGKQQNNRRNRKWRRSFALSLKSHLKKKKAFKLFPKLFIFYMRMFLFLPRKVFKVKPQPTNIRPDQSDEFSCLHGRVVTDYLLSEGHFWHAWTKKMVWLEKHEKVSVLKCHSIDIPYDDKAILTP